MKRLKNKPCICAKCNESINEEKDKYVILTTVNEGKTIEKVYFHINCWKNYFAKCVSKKIEVLKDKAMSMLRSKVKVLKTYN